MNGIDLNNPTIQLNFGTKLGDPFNSSKCGPYTLAKPDPSAATSSRSCCRARMHLACGVPEPG